MFFDVNKSIYTKNFMAKYVDKVMADNFWFRCRIYQWQSTNKQILIVFYIHNQEGTNPDDVWGWGLMFGKQNLTF